jgi:hypothetical protein
MEAVGFIIDSGQEAKGGNLVQMGNAAAQILLMLLVVPGLTYGQPIAVRGTYATPKAFWDQGAKLDDYGINAVFVHAGSINTELMRRATGEGARVFAEFATLNGKGYVEDHPEAWPVNERGERAPAATWFLGACPTEPGFRQFRLRQLAELLEKYPLSGVWMDYFHWHAQFEDPQPVLPETCFSDTCLREFARAARVRLPDGSTAEKARFILSRHERAWRTWRTEVLAEWAREFRKVIEAKRPGALLGVYHCPWNDTEFGGAQRRILGLDYDVLAPLIDVFSPMVYHGRMERKPAWVGESVRWLSARLPEAARIWPIVQAHGEPAPISAVEFEEVMRGGASGRATGVMMFTFGSVAQDKEKMQVLQHLYRKWAGGQ